MEQIKEAVYLINDERYLHLRENGAGVGFATYNKVTGEPLESGQISEKNLPPDGQNTIPAARNWYLFELSDDDRKAIQQESVKILENIPQAGIGRRRIWEPETLPKDIRLINSHYDDLYRIPDGGVIQVDYPDGRSFTARVEHLDDYHFDMGGLGNVFHICQFAEVMERNHADFYPEIQTQDEQTAWELGFILARLLKRFSSVFTKRPDILVTVPMELSEIEMRAFYKVLTGLKVRRIALVEKGVADAVGIGMPVLAQTGSMVVNIGASTTGISVISDGKVIIGRQYPYGGNAMDQAVITMVRREHNLAIGKKTAEKLRVAMGYLMNGEAKSSEVYGIHTISGVPSSARIPSEDISKAITDTADAIADAVKMTLQRTPPQLLENIQQNGIYLAGGVSLTPNIASYIQEKVTFPVYNVPDPVYNTMNGLVEIMNDKELKKLTFSLKDYVGNLI